MDAYGLADEVDHALVPAGAQGSDAFVGPATPFVERDAKSLELFWQPSRADSHDQSPAGEPVEGRQLLGEVHRMSVRHHEHAGAEPDAGCHSCRPGQGDEGLVQIRRHGRALRDADVIADPDIVEAKRLGLLRRLANRVGVRRSTVLREMDAEFHTVLFSTGSNATTGECKHE